MAWNKVILISCSLLLAFNAAAQKQKPLYKKVSAQWAFIPNGILDILNPYISDVSFSKKPDTIHVKEFWISKTEISNGEYLQFVEATIKSGDLKKLDVIMPDTSVWRSNPVFNEPYVEYYLRHPAYRDYPVVGVSHEAAMLYCQWLMDVYNNKLKELFPKLKARRIEIKLPSLNEWKWAAKGGLNLSPYPWGGPYLRNSQGDYQCNFMRIGEASIRYDASTGEPKLVSNHREDYMGMAGLPDDHANITAPVKSYWPNAYGLYNMGGNVAEMIDKPGTAKGGSWKTCGYDVLIEAPDPFEGDLSPKAFVGFRPVFVIVE